ncbi:family 16 glycosylhydrolase [Flavobacterium terrisoli]|uniref:family 16 glycosylhydrolase n=1 Tax=Flavobacterium terrisoli TaxID=3242195 RepID=UPI002543A4C9|nr:family 16 glycosylhydrolase [Flavobacterium buctense]
MRNFLVIVCLLIFFTLQAQVIQDNFEGNGNIATWFGDDCAIEHPFANPFQSGTNTSANVLRYADTGDAYANVRFDSSYNFDLTPNSSFSFKIYIPSNSITGTQPNQISLKLQNGDLAEPWTSQCEIIKPLLLNQWQTITFDFATNPYLNYNPNSGNPINRYDFNRVVIQINGEGNTDQVLAYIDDFYHAGSVNPVFNNLVWSDEFDVPGAVNSLKWHHQTQLPNGDSWYNGEIQHYTNRQINSNVSGGFLNIVARKETYTDQGVTKQYTSARLNSKFAFTYGRMEVRAKLPSGAGTWPAIWTLGKNVIEPGAYWSATNGTVNWPACGEIDVMEHWGNNQNFVQSAMHTPSSFGNTVNLGGQTIPTASSQFHIYALDWNSERMIFTVDDVIHYVYNPAVKNASTWPFNAPQYILLNFAIEGNIPASFNQGTFQVDYVRVYQESTLSNAEPIALSEPVLFPNPVENELTIENINSEMHGKIYSLLGQELQSFMVNENQSTVDFSAYAKGIYIVKIETETGTKTYKILKN